MFQNGLFLLTISALVSLIFTSLPTRSMGVSITCQPNLNCIGTNGDDVIKVPGPGPYGLILGEKGSDVIYGSPLNDRIEGGGGDDIIYGRGGDDELKGGPGPDTDFIDGGYGNDQIYGADGTDLLAGGPDNDTILGGTSKDTIYGGLGSDSIEQNDDFNDRDFAKDIIDCGSGTDDPVSIRSSDSDIAANDCEGVTDFDG